MESRTICVRLFSFFAIGLDISEESNQGEINFW